MTDPSASTPIPPQPASPRRRAFYAVPPETVAAYWWSDVTAGLSEAEAQRRAQRLGPNKLAERPPPTLLARLLAQISDVTVLALLAAAAIATLLAVVAPEPDQGFFARFGDGIAIVLIVVINAVLGLVNERTAENALGALREMTAPVARVLREGVVKERPAAELVPGDVVLLEEGDKVAADLRLVASSDLEIEEAALTGESVPVRKDAALVLPPETALADRLDMAYMGTRVTRGRGRGLVCNTGMHTELGAIAGMLAEVERDETPLEQQLARFGKQIVLGCVLVSALVFVAGWLVGGQSMRQMFLVAVSLAVAAIPEGLPAITTIVLALGTTRMAKRNALVRRLPAVETLGAAQIICTDKTGTLTQNAMTARRVWAGGARFEVGGEGRLVVGELRREGSKEPVVLACEPALELAIHAAAHASGATVTRQEGDDARVEVTGDPTDAALLVLAWKGKARKHAGVIAHEVPFTSARRMATVIANEAEGPVAFVRGAPEVLLGLSEEIHEGGAPRPMTEADRAAIAAVASEWGAAAMRVVALAVRRRVPTDPDPSHWERALTFVALVGIVDPPRPQVKAAIAAARAAGIRSMMITGDHPATARAIGTEIGLVTEGDVVLTGQELDTIEDQALEARIDDVAVVARATAAHKLRVVEALKARGRVCAMTGDGVNDAPAVKSAHIGIAMGRTGTEVTKEAADLVLADDDYATIVAAIEEGRAIYANIRKFIYFLLSSNAGIVLTVLVASLAGWAAPLTPIQILWINLITNGLPALALGVDPKDPDQMREPPRATTDELMPRADWVAVIWVGAVMGALALGAFWLAVPGGGASLDGAAPALARGRTLAFAVLSLAPMFHALDCRSRTRSIVSMGLLSNRALVAAIALGVVLVAVATYVPGVEQIFKTAALDGGDVGVVLGLSAVPLVIGELIKLARRSLPQPSAR